VRSYLAFGWWLEVGWFDQFVADDSDMEPAV
jgi:hypothetical protein